MNDFSEESCDGVDSAGDGGCNVGIEACAKDRVSCEHEFNGGCGLRGICEKTGKDIVHAVG